MPFDLEQPIADHGDVIYALNRRRHRNCHTTFALVGLQTCQGTFIYRTHPTRTAPDRNN